MLIVALNLGLAPGCGGDPAAPPDDAAQAEPRDGAEPRDVIDSARVVGPPVLQLPGGGPALATRPPAPRPRWPGLPSRDLSTHREWATRESGPAQRPLEPSYGTTLSDPTGRGELRLSSLPLPGGAAPATTVSTRRSADAPWSRPTAAPAALVGSGHAATWLPDGRVAVAFHDGHPDSPTRGDVLVWVGTWDDLTGGWPGSLVARVVDHGPDDHAPLQLPAEAPEGWPPAGLEGLGELSWSSVAGQALDTTRANASLRLAVDDDSLVLVVDCRDVVDERGARGRRRTRLRVPLESLAEPAPTAGHDLSVVDLDGDAERFVVVDREPGQYLGHVTTVLLEDGRTLLATYPQGHGRGAIVLKRSSDGGRSWSQRLPVPASWASSQEVPTIHRVIDPVSGARRLILWSGLYPARLAVSEDDGHSWSELEPAGDWGGIVVMGDVERLSDGRYLALFHDDGRFFSGEDRRSDPVTFTLYQTVSADGGLSWSFPTPIWSGSDVHLCEPGIVRSPDGATLAALLRENSRRRNSFVIFSEDEGASWSAPRELPAALTGDRHTAAYAPDGRLLLSFRDTTRQSDTQGDWVGWVGTWDDLWLGRAGQYRVRFKDNLDAWDSTYPGVEVLRDGSFAVTTYGHWDPGEEPYILCARFSLDELDARLAEGR